MTGIAEQFNSRPSLLTQYNYYNPTENVLHLGVVCSYSQLNNLQGKALVYIPKLKYCLNAAYSASYQGLNNTGVYHPLMVGESVLVSYLEGITESAQIVGHKRWNNNLDKILSPDKEMLVTSPENIPGGGPPGSQIPDVLKMGGLAHVTTYPVASTKENKNNSPQGQLPVLSPREIEFVNPSASSEELNRTYTVEEIDRIEKLSTDDSQNQQPQVSPSYNGLETTEPGHTIISDFFGNTRIFLPGNLITEANVINNISTGEKIGLQEEIGSEQERKNQLREFLEKASFYKNNIPLINENSISYESSFTTFVNDYPNHNEGEQVLNQGIAEGRENDGNESEQRIDDIDKEEECIEKVTEQVKDKSKKFFDKLLEEIISQVKSVALERLNKLLPSFLSVDIEVERDEQDQIVVTRVRVGDVTYEVKSGTIIVNGQVFRPLENLLVSELNKILPPFLRVTASELGIEIGSVVIRTKDIDPTKDQSFPINENSVLLNKKGTLFIQFAGAVFSLGRLEDLVIAKTFAEISRQVNQILPDFLQFSLFRDSAGHTTISLGPFSVKLSGPGAGLSVDYISLQSIINIIPNRLISRLSPPVALIARILWEPLSEGILNLIKDLILGPDRNKVKKEEEVESISKQIDPCRGEQRNIPPISVDTYPSYPSYPGYA